MCDHVFGAAAAQPRCHVSGKVRVAAAQSMLAKRKESFHNCRPWGAQLVCLAHSRGTAPLTPARQCACHHRASPTPPLLLASAGQGRPTARALSQQQRCAQHPGLTDESRHQMGCQRCAGVSTGFLVLVPLPSFCINSGAGCREALDNGRHHFSLEEVHLF